MRFFPNSSQFLTNYFHYKYYYLDLFGSLLDTKISCNNIVYKIIFFHIRLLKLLKKMVLLFLMALPKSRHWFSWSRSGWREENGVWKTDTDPGYRPCTWIFHKCSCFWDRRTFNSMSKSSSILVLFGFFIWIKYRSHIYLVV